MKRSDGSIITQYFQPQDKPTSGDDVYDQGIRMVVGQIEKIYFVDDQANVSKKFVEYDVSIRDSKGGQSKYRNIRKIDLLGGATDYDELVLEANEFAFKGKLDTSNFFVNKNGTAVIVAFLDGSKDKPVIIAALQHPRRDGAKRSDGVRRKGEFRGIQWEINKDGELIITQQGPRGSDGKLKTPDKTNTVVTFDKDGNFTLKDKAGDQIKVDNSSKKIELTTASGPSVVIDGSGVITLTANSTVITIDGTNGKISLTGSLVDVGEAASALAALGPQLVAWLTVHSHGNGNLGAPTTAPIVPPPISTLSTSVRLKA